MAIKRLNIENILKINVLVTFFNTYFSFGLIVLFIAYWLKSYFVLVLFILGSMVYTGLSIYVLNLLFFRKYEYFDRFETKDIKVNDTQKEALNEVKEWKDEALDELAKIDDELEE